MTSFLNNESKEITEETDHFGLLPEIDIIYNILSSPEFISSGLSTIAIYGSWGTGKSSLMKTLIKRLEQHETALFEAWKFEKDNNLSMSLIDFLSSEKFPKYDSTDELLATSWTFLKGLVKGITIDTKVIKFSAKDALEDVEEQIDEREAEKYSSQYKIHEEFKKEFQKFLHSLLQRDKNKRLYVFIDDLDRCEPEGVLNLISSIKNFFTFDDLRDRVFFIAGIDRNAVGQAIRTRYGDVIGSDQYLEKVFDFTFELPNLKPNLLHYQHVFNGVEERYIKQLNEYLSFIGFDSPRKVKKMMNQYYRLRLLSTSNLQDPILRRFDFSLLDRENYYEHVFLINLLILK